MVDVGEALKLMAEVKDSLDINVKQTFIDPLQLLQDKDLKEIGVSLPDCPVPAADHNGAMTYNQGFHTDSATTQSYLRVENCPWLLYYMAP